MFDERFRSDGLLVIDRLLPPDLLSAIADLSRRWAEPAGGAPPHEVDRGRLHMPARMEGPLLDSRLWGNPVLERILAALLGSDYLIDSITVVNALPGAPTMHLHRDHGDLFPEASVGEVLPPYALSMIVPLVPTDDQTGTTMIARASGSARKVDQETLDPPADWVIPHVPLGGCVLMDYRLWHRGMANRSSRDRPILYIVFAREWFTDTRNFEVHPRMLIDRTAVERIDPADRHLFRRATGAGLANATVAELGAGSVAAPPKG